jgi:hypothetical protein
MGGTVNGIPSTPWGILRPLDRIWTAAVNPIQAPPPPQGPGCGEAGERGGCGHAAVDRFAFGVAAPATAWFSLPLVAWG